MNDATKKATDKNLKKELNDLRVKFEILQTARKEDAHKIIEAEQTVLEYTKKIQELNTRNSQQLAQLNNIVQEQKNVITDLFDMMDHSINTQIFYYNKFKGIFLQPEQLIPEENQNGN